MSTATKPNRRPAHVSPTRKRRTRTPDGHGPPRLSESAQLRLDGSAEGRGERDRRLEEVVLTTWAALVAGHPVECPVCGGPLTAARGCTGCGARLT